MLYLILKAALSLLPVYLRDRGRPDRAIAVGAIAIALWIPAFLWTAAVLIFRNFKMRHYPNSGGVLI